MRNVYINPDLTKAQATATYQLRCQKRQARMEKNYRQANTSAPPSMSEAQYVAPGEQVKSQLNNAPSGSCSYTAFNSSAAEFVPSLSTTP